MKRLPIKNMQNGKCPKCSNTMILSYGKVKEKKLRTKMWISFAFFVISALPRIMELIRLEFDCFSNAGWWICLGIAIIAFGIFLTYFIKVKKFESKYRDFAYCEKCKTIWLIDFLMPY